MLESLNSPPFSGKDGQQSLFDTTAAPAASTKIPAQEIIDASCALKRIRQDMAAHMPRKVEVIPQYPLSERTIAIGKAGVADARKKLDAARGAREEGGAGEYTKTATSSDARTEKLTLF